MLGKSSVKGHLEYLFPFSDWKWDLKNASFFDASIFDPIFQSENGKLSRAAAKQNVPVHQYVHAIAMQHTLRVG